jgi:hypothetical protein
MKPFRKDTKTRPKGRESRPEEEVEDRWQVDPVFVVDFDSSDEQRPHLPPLPQLVPD